MDRDPPAVLALELSDVLVDLLRTTAVAGRRLDHPNPLSLLDVLDGAGGVAMLVRDLLALDRDARR